jgi:hypothetical protein
MAVSLPMARKREDNVVQFGIDELEGRLRALTRIAWAVAVARQ